VINDKTLDSVGEIVNTTNLAVKDFFTCPIYLVERPDFLESVSAVSEEYLSVRREQPVDEIYPVLMSDSYSKDSRIAEFTEFVGVTAWKILADQGYAMHQFEMVFTGMWTQEHHRHSAMEQHVHGYGEQIVGFYFLEVPDNSSRVVFHDPRAGKVQIDLPQTDVTQATPASSMVNFVPTPGLMIFTNSWLAHSFTRHAAEKPIKFVHFNLAVQHATSNILSCSTAEVI